ncbi:hypothetical protein GCM10022258_41980 [Aquimarina gracilis]
MSITSSSLAHPISATINKNNNKLFKIEFFIVLNFLGFYTSISTTTKIVTPKHKKVFVIRTIYTYLQKLLIY